MALSSLLKTDTEDLKGLFSNGKNYLVPAYQRDYSWKEEQWEDLWADLLQVEITDEDHYMGSVVFVSEERKSFRIIDGQQRLATLSILILAGIETIKVLVETGFFPEENRERIDLLEKSYVGTKDPASLLITPKLKLNLHDNDFFQLNLAQRKPPQGGTRHLRDSEKLIWQCYKFFEDHFSKKFSAEDKGREIAQFINEVVTDRLIFITVQVPDQLSAYTVFETLNARGLELTETDLLKNYLLSLAEKLSKSQMEPVLKQWTRITSRVSIASFPEFLRHHRNSEKRYVRQKQLFKTIKTEITTLPEVFALLDRLEKDAVWYEALRDHGSDFWLDYPGAKEQVRVLNLFGVSQYLPFFLAAKEIFLAPNEVVEILRYCGIISVRFNGVSRRSTHILEEIYNKAALFLRNHPQSSLAEIRSTLRPIYITDQEFEDDFASLQMKNRGQSAKRLRYFLAKIEKQLSGNDLSDETMQASVEHILPDNLPLHGWEIFSEEVHDRCVLRLGNFTLLEKKMNNQLGDAPFEQKKAIYAESDYKLSRDVAQYQDWSEAIIEDRQRKLAKIAKTVWSLSA